MNDVAPIPMIIHCPSCHLQHIDAPEPERGWTNPPHKSHLCHGCGAIWRPATVPTVGVEKIVCGPSDTWPPLKAEIEHGLPCTGQLVHSEFEYCPKHDSKVLRRWTEPIIAKDATPQIPRTNAQAAGYDVIETHPFKPNTWPKRDECDAKVSNGGRGLYQCGRPRSEHTTAEASSTPDQLLSPDFPGFKR